MFSFENNYYSYLLHYFYILINSWVYAIPINHHGSKKIYKNKNAILKPKINLSSFSKIVLTLNHLLMLCNLNLDNHFIKVLH
jgi:hypothetical protein